MTPRRLAAAASLVTLITSALALWYAYDAAMFLVTGGR